MNKADLIQEFSEKEKLTRKQAEQVVETIFEQMAKTIKNEGRIEIRGFGSFAVRSYKAYQGRNPRTGQKIKVKEKKLPFFKAGKELKKQVNDSKDTPLK